MSVPAPRSGSTEHFYHVEAGSGIALLSAAVAALIWANSPWSSAYSQLWGLPLSVGTGHFTFSRPLQFWISDGLMTFFFLLVGLEIRREIHEGALATRRAALLPAVAATGGIIVPAMIYIWINQEPSMRHGWAIPTATDIAFATGALGLLGRRVSPVLRVLLLSVAVIDDIAAILLITFFYSTKLDPIGLAIAAVGAAGLATLLTLPRDLLLRPSRFLLERFVFGIFVWIGLLHAGSHPALAGAILGLLMPMDLVRSVEQRLHPWVAYGIMPLYALANAGVKLLGFGAGSNSTVPLMVGVIIALVIGKPVGITLSTALCVKVGVCALPTGIDIKQIFVIGCMAGMGFTMSIFVCHLAFVGEPLAASKLAVLISSALAALVGLVAGRWLLAPTRAAP